MTEAECMRMIADEVKAVRSRYEPTMTQEKLAEKCGGKTKQAICNIEKAKYFAQVSTLLEIANATKTNLVIRFMTDEEMATERELWRAAKKKSGAN